MFFNFFKMSIPFIGKKSVFWLSISFLFSIILSLIELLFALFLQLFLVTLGLLNIPIKILGYSLTDVGISFVIISLMTLGFIRFIAQLLCSHSCRFALEYSNSRFKNLAIYDLLYRASGEDGGASDVNYKISEIFPKSSEFISNVVYFVSSSIQCFVLFLIMLFTTYKETALATIGILVIGYFVHVVNKNVRKMSNQIPREQQKLNAGIEKISKNLLFIKVMKTSTQEHKNLLESILNYCLKSTRANFLATLAMTGSPFFGIILLVVIIFMSQAWWHTPALTLVSFLYLLVRFIQNLSILALNFGNLNTTYSQVKIGAEYFFKFKEDERNYAMLPAEQSVFLGSRKNFILPENYFYNIKQEAKHLEYKKDIVTILPSIQFDDVSFSYAGSNNLILKNLNIDINAGEHIGIIGPSGSGKSTILMLLLGIIQPTQGKICIAGLPPEVYFNSLNSKVGYVGPEPFLIKGTIKENLLYGIKAKISEKQIWESLQLASLHEFVKSTTLEYCIPEDQSGLSAGQKQRLCLARAFLNTSQLLVLDEATANLDEATETDIAIAIQKLKEKCTTIIVSHRPGILKSVDKIIDLRSE